MQRQREIEAINGGWAVLGLTIGVILEGYTGNGILAQVNSFSSFPCCSLKISFTTVSRGFDEYTNSVCKSSLESWKSSWLVELMWIEVDVLTFQ